MHARPIKNIFNLFLFFYKSFFTNFFIFYKILSRLFSSIQTLVVVTILRALRASDPFL